MVIPKPFSGAIQRNQEQFQFIDQGQHFTALGVVGDCLAQIRTHALQGGCAEQKFTNTLWLAF